MRASPSRSITDLIKRLAREHEVLITVEEGAIGGFGAHVMQFLAWEGLLDRGLKFRPMVLPDRFIDQDSPERMYEAAGLDAKAIVNGRARGAGPRSRCRRRARVTKPGARLRADVFLVEHGYAASRAEAQAAIAAGGARRRRAICKASQPHRRSGAHRL